MNNRFFKNLLIVLLALLLSAAFPTLSNASGKAKRGDYPQCQEECLSRLRKRMAQVSEEYRSKVNRLLYEERVEQARIDYNDCIVNCKEPRPVK